MFFLRDNYTHPAFRQAARDMLPLACRSRPLRILCIEEDTLQRKLLAACLDAIKSASGYGAAFAPSVTTLRLISTIRLLSAVSERDTTSQRQAPGAPSTR